MASYVELYYDGILDWPGFGKILAGGHLVTEKKGSESDFFYWKLSHLGFGHSLASI